MTRWIELWNRYWFPTTSTLNLAACRILTVATALYWFSPSLEGHINLLSKNSEFIDPQVLVRAITLVVPRGLFFTAEGFTVLYWVTSIAAITALVGLFTRFSMFVYALGTWIFVSHRYSYADVHHPEALLAIFLMTLALAPSGRSLSVDALIRSSRARRASGSAEPDDRSDMAMWPLKLMHVLLAMTYFSTGISKLLSGGLTWMNGYTLQIYTFSDAIANDRPLGIWLAQQYELCVVLAAFTIVFELFFFVSLLLPRVAPLFFLTGLLFHVGLVVTSGHPFYAHILLNALLLVFLDPEWFPTRWKRLSTYFSRGRRHEQAHQPS